MAITPTSSSMSALANELFRQVDANTDGKLSATEFQSFLESLLSGVNNRRVPGISASAVSGPRTDYAPMEGFDTAKLNNPAHATPKYVFARATQDIAMGVGRAARSAALPEIVSYIRANGYPNAAATDDDIIDFGDGFGDIDVLTADGRWWWGPEN